MGLDFYPRSHAVDLRVKTQSEINCREGQTEEQYPEMETARELVFFLPHL